MDEETGKLKKLIDNADSILITSHISPDPDSLCSILLAGMAVEQNFSDKRVVMVSEELTGGLIFLNGYSQLQQKPLLQAIAEAEPGLIIIIDAMNFSRCTRQDVQALQEKIKQLGSKTAIIDHHEPEGVEVNDVYINRGSPAATQDVYKLMFDDLGLNKPVGYAQTALVGIVSDTNRFMYDNPRHRETFTIVSDLLDAGASIEETENLRTRYSLDQMHVLSELTSNAVTDAGFSYSYISDKFKDEWFASGKDQDELKLACQIFVNDYVRNIGENKWGFMVYPDVLGGDKIYSASFRALSNVKDVAEVAKRLGGGGHKASAGAKFPAENAEEAIKKIKDVIAELA